MRKTLSLVLSIVMILSLAIIGVSAEGEATVINTAEEFAAMAADGNYKLGKDITIAATYASDFTGTFDGDGHTVTVSAPMFNYMNGTVKNLTIKGEITSSETHVAPLALRGKGTIVIENVVNEANVNLTNRGSGVISQIDNGSTVTMKNVVNKGKITSTGDSGSMVGGILGYIQGDNMIMIDCVNLGDVSADKGNAGGIVGRTGGDTPTANVHIMTIKNCLNEGDVTSAGVAAGIVGYARGITLNIENCTNTGKIVSTGNDGAAGMLASSNVLKPTSGTYKDVSNVGNCFVNIKSCLNEGDITCTGARAGGMAGYVWAGGGAKNKDFLDDAVSTHIEVIGCINKGAITGKSFASQMAAYSNSNLNVIKDNVGLGTVAGTDADTKLAFLGFSSAAIPSGMTGNKIVADGTEYYTYTATADKSANIIKIADLNADHGLAVVSANDAQAAAAALGDIGYIAPVEDPVNPPVVDPVNPPATGDALVWVAIVAAVAVLGMGIAIKAKQN